MIVCKQCHRHVRESQCPFCGADNAGAPALAGTAAHRVGMKRTAVIVGVLAVAAVGGTAGCASPPPPADAPDVVTTSDVYGIPTDTPMNNDAADVVTMGDVYGIPTDNPVTPADATDVVTMGDVYGIPTDGN